jgi:hypothetical protein
VKKIKTKKVESGKYMGLVRPQGVGFRADSRTDGQAADI